MDTQVAIPIETEPGNYFISNYPPYSCWKPEQVPDFESRIWQKCSSAPLSVYVHIPFCRQRCSYCYFRVYPNRKAADVDRYVSAVLAELDLWLKRPAVTERPVHTVYFGGGSPSYLAADQIDRLLHGLQERLPWKDVQEFTYECEPGTVSPMKLRTLKARGVTRVSLGFQTLTEHILQNAGRRVSRKDALDAFWMARRAGFDEINIDMLAGLPGESRFTWLQSLDRVISLEPECVTLYQMELTHNSRLCANVKNQPAGNLPSWIDKRAWVEEGFTHLEKAGYSVVSGYMAIRDPSTWRFRYTVDRYWHGEDLLSLGESSFGYLCDTHYQNLDRFDLYSVSVEKRRLPVARAYSMDEEARMRREAILLLKTGHLDGSYFRKKYGVDIGTHFEDVWRTLCSQGLAEIGDGSMRLTRKGLLCVDALLPAFYLPDHRVARYT